MALPMFFLVEANSSSFSPMRRSISCQHVLNGLTHVLLGGGKLFILLTHAAVDLLP